MTIQNFKQTNTEKLRSLVRSYEEAGPQKAIDFISNGIGCFAITLIEKLGVLPTFIENGYLDEKDLNNKKNYRNAIAINSALISLCSCKVLTKQNTRYYLTSLGLQLIKHIGLVTMLFDGYGELMGKGSRIILKKVKHPEKYLNGASIALSSIQFGENTVDPLVLEVIKKMGLKGTICDLGCGTADRLIKLCKATGQSGLGLDANNEAVQIANELTKNYPKINVEIADVEKLNGIWEDVEILMQSFMTHDIFPDEKCIQVLNSYQSNFPNLKYFIVIDIVAPEDNFASHMPGYDYVHGLLGIETRKYDRFTSLFTKSGYEISNEIAIKMPNTYLWILKRK